MLVSCIIPTHNRSLFLKKAVESTVNQSYKDLEIIIVDDASEDDTRSVVTEYMKRDDRISYYRNDRPLGGSGARNAGIKMAKGEFIAFLDDDDQWKTDKIERQLAAIENFDAVLCARILSSNGRVSKYKKSLVDPDDLRKGNVLGGTSALLARSLIIKDNLFDTRLPNGEDYDLFIRLCKNYKLRYIVDPLVIYNEGEHSRVTNRLINMQLDQLENRLNVIYKHRDFFGPFWFNYHVARILLSYMRSRKNKFKHIIYAMRRCGIFPVLRILYSKIMLNLSNH